MRLGFAYRSGPRVRIHTLMAAALALSAGCAGSHLELDPEAAKVDRTALLPEYHAEEMEIRDSGALVLIDPTWFGPKAAGGLSFVFTSLANARLTAIGEQLLEPHRSRLDDVDIPETFEDRLVAGLRREGLFGEIMVLHEPSVAIHSSNRSRAKESGADLLFELELDFAVAEAGSPIVMAASMEVRDPYEYTYEIPPLYKRTMMWVSDNPDTLRDKRFTERMNDYRRVVADNVDHHFGPESGYPSVMAQRVEWFADLFIQDMIGSGPDFTGAKTASEIYEPSVRFQNGLGRSDLVLEDGLGRIIVNRDGELYYLPAPEPEPEA